MGDTKNFNIAWVEIRLDVILSTEGNDVLFGRVVICAFWIAWGMTWFFAYFAAGFVLALEAGMVICPTIRAL